MITDFIIYIINSIISIVALVLNGVFGLLPDTPFKVNETSALFEYIGYLNWIIPFKELIIVTVSWLSAISVYYIYQIVLRWIKGIE